MTLYHRILESQGAFKFCREHDRQLLVFDGRLWIQKAGTKMRPKDGPHRTWVWARTLALAMEVLGCWYDLLWQVCRRPSVSALLPSVGSRFQRVTASPIGAVNPTVGVDRRHPEFIPALQFLSTFCTSFSRNLHGRRAHTLPIDRFFGWVSIVMVRSLRSSQELTRPFGQRAGGLPRALAVAQTCS